MRYCFPSLILAIGLAVEAKYLGALLSKSEKDKSSAPVQFAPAAPVYQPEL
jgi:hypothetical protein